LATHLLIQGRVQGVGYRASFASVAAQLGLAGWVRNRLDGSVEACVHGSTGQIEAIVTWARKGPPASRVDEVLVSDSEELSPSDGKFAIHPTR